MSTVTLSSTVRWLLAPAVDEVPRSHASASTGLRVLAGLLWLYNVSWKQPPDFGRDSGSGVYGFTKDAVDHPVFPPFSWVVEHLVLPNFAAFGWGVLAVETALAVLLLTGAFVRLAALLGIGQALAIGLSVAQTPGEWPWAYWMMIGIHVVLLFSAAGRLLAVDAVRARVSTEVHDWRALSLVWGVVVAGAGLVALVLSLGEDPLAAGGEALGGPGLSISLGSYNLLGALALLVVGSGLVGAALTRQALPGRVAAALAVLAALSLYVQLPWTDSWVGGNNTSAAFFLCAATIGWVTSTSARRTKSESGTAHQDRGYR